jgi:hypothetical protein
MLATLPSSPLPFPLLSGAADNGGGVPGREMETGHQMPDTKPRKEPDMNTFGPTDRSDDDEMHRIGKRADDDWNPHPLDVLYCYPRRTSENRPVVDGSKPASAGAPQARALYCVSAQ